MKKQRKMAIREKKPTRPIFKGNPLDPTVYFVRNGAKDVSAEVEPTGNVAIYRGFSINKEGAVRKNTKGQYSAVPLTGISPVFDGKSLVEIISKIDFYLFKESAAKAA